MLLKLKTTNDKTSLVNIDQIEQAMSESDVIHNGSPDKTIIYWPDGSQRTFAIKLTTLWEEYNKLKEIMGDSLPVEEGLSSAFEVEFNEFTPDKDASLTIKRTGIHTKESPQLSDHVTEAETALKIWGEICSLKSKNPDVSMMQFSHELYDIFDKYICFAPAANPELTDAPEPKFQEGDKVCRINDNRIGTVKSSFLADDGKGTYFYYNIYWVNGVESGASEDEIKPTRGKE